ncbi:MAG TPA: hypothetical protein VMV17_06440 [Streptosporangiaceae bacterium]|nr:hypothetical protein [Streptosporangiaceae bacterium]
MLIWLLLCPVAVAAGSMYCAWVTLGTPRLDRGSSAWRSAWRSWPPVAGLLDVAARRRQARGGREPVLSWRLYVALPCMMSGPVLLPVFQHLPPGWLPAHWGILVTQVLLSLAGCGLMIQNAWLQQRRRTAAAPAGPDR